MAGRFADLDALLGELDEKPVEIRLYGRMWQLPASVPAKLVLRLERAQAYAAERLVAGADAEDPDEVPDTEGLDVFTVAHTVCGKDNVDAWLDEGIDDTRLWALIFRVLAIHRGHGDERPEEASAGKPKAPSRGRSGKSSRSSGPSKQTSGASTGSGSPKSSTG